MAFPVGTRANGAFITASIWNQDLVDNLNALHEASSALGVFNVVDEDFGAVGDGVTDDTAAIQAAIDAALGTLAGDTAPSGTVWIPNGDYRITSTLLVENHSGLTIQGLGGNTRLIWDGDATGPMFSVYGSRMTSFINFQMTIAPGKSLTNMVVQEQPPLAGTGQSSMNRYERVLIEGLGAMECGISVEGDTTDANNDFTTFETVWIFGYTEAAVTLEGANAFLNQFRNVQFGGARVGNYGIKLLNGAGGQTAGIQMYSGALLGHLVADIYQETICFQPLTIDGVYSEGSNAFFYQNNITGSQGGVILRGCLFSADLKDNTDPIIKFSSCGPYLIDHCIFASYDLTNTSSVHWTYVPNYFGPSLEVRGCRFWTDQTTLHGIFTGQLPTVIKDTYLINNFPDDVGVPPMAIVRLDDHEDSVAGEFVPALKDDFGGSATYTTCVGWWSKEKHEVKMGGEIQLSSVGTLSGNLFIDIPFISAVDNYASQAFGFWLNTAVDISMIGGRVGPGGDSFMHFYVRRDSIGYLDNLQAADLTDTFRLTWQLTYKANEPL